MASRDYTGILEHVDLGSGAWVLVDDDGTRWQLDGDIPDKLVGRRVRLTGKESAGFGFAMSGPTLKVREVKAT